MKIEIIVPAAGESVTEADIASWYKEDGEFVQMDDTILELETNKASLDMAAEASGVLNILAEEGDIVKVGQVIGTIDTEGVGKVIEEVKAPAMETPNTVTAPPAAPSETHHAFGAPSPAARVLMTEHQLSAQDITGTGPDGRITKTDVLDHIAKRHVNVTGEAPKAVAAPAPAKKTAPVAPEVTVVAGERNVRTERMSRLRRTISERLVEAQQTAAILTTFNEVDMSGIMDIRKKYKDAFKEKHQVNLGFMSFFAKATAMALEEFPIMNAQVDGNSVVYHDFVDLGIAVSTPKGLVVPVVKNLETMNFKQVEAKILELALKGRDSNLTPDEMTGGTFTITNGGTFGSMLSTPILNRPQSAILGMHNIVQRPVAVNGEVVIRPIMYLAVSYDHRIIDGSDAVRFLVKIKQLLEDPTRIMLEI